MSERSVKFYSCANCPAYCCTYDQIKTTAADIRRLARHFGLSEEQARRRFTKPVEGGALGPAERIDAGQLDPDPGAMVREVPARHRHELWHEVDADDRAGM